MIGDDGRRRAGRDPPPRRGSRSTLAEDVRLLGGALVAFSPAMTEDLARLRAFLYQRMYRHWRVNRTRSQARRILAEMFELFLAEPDVLPTRVVWPPAQAATRRGPRPRSSATTSPA